jgi:C-terminal processing protease CtpA/Prc
MHKIIFYLITFILSSLNVSAQKITETEKLAATAKVWGFLKYYHPEVAKGKMDWDSQLFTLLPKVEQAQNKEELSKVFSDLIVSLGEIKKCNTCAKQSKKEYFNKNLDLSWTLNQKLFTPELSAKLKFIEENRFQGKQHYVNIPDRVGNIQITNEIEYPNFDWNNQNLRLLAIFRYWNIVEYFFPYKYQMDQNWETTLEEMVPRFKNPKSEEDYHLAMLELVVKIDDSHGMFITKKTNDYFGLKWIPADFKIIDNKAIITNIYNDSLAKKDDIQINDIITKVNGKPISEIIQGKEKYINASNPAIKIRNSSYAVFNGSTDKVEMEFTRNGTTKSKTVNRYLYKDFKYEYPKKEKWKILNDNIGYVNMGDLQFKDVESMSKELKSTKAIVFDIRNYPNGTMYLISRFLNSERKQFYKQTMPDLTYPGRYIWGEPKECGLNQKENYKGKVILLVNEKTQSHAEFTAMALQTANNVTIIGSQTAGADGNISRFELVGGFKTIISGIGIYYPDGRETQRIGIVPNIEVKPTIDGILKGKDEVLDSAITFIKNGN